MSENAISRQELHILINNQNDHRIGLFNGYRFYHGWFDEPGDFDSAFRKIREHSDRRSITVYFREEARTREVLGEDGQLHPMIDLLVELRVGHLMIICSTVDSSLNYQSISKYPGTSVKPISEKTVSFKICAQGMVIIADIIYGLKHQANLLLHYQNDLIRINEEIQGEMRKQAEWIAQQQEKRMNQQSEEPDERQQIDDEYLQRSLPPSVE